ncbi:MAG: hypothetical protein LLG13_02140 [Bacteroidales bacterium]|nr:hypothetical protein [Bacteroidales bacterium]
MKVNYFLSIQLVVCIFLLSSLTNLQIPDPHEVIKEKGTDLANTKIEQGV